jgi:hypothetical protein
MDAELVSANWDEMTLESKLFVIGALLLTSDWLWRLPRWVHLVVASIAFVLIVTASITRKWAQAEQAFSGEARASRKSSGIKLGTGNFWGETTCT